MMFLLSKAFTAFFLPPGLFILAFLAATALFLAGKRKAGAVTAILSLSLLALVSLRVVSDALIRPLEDLYPPADIPALSAGAKGGGADAPLAVVVLSGGYIERSPEEGGHASLSPDSMKRLLYGLRLAKATGLPLVFTGGSFAEGGDVETEADGARSLVEGFGSGVEVRYESHSRTTRENARNVAAMVGKGPVVLVTSAYHMARSVWSFQAEGVGVYAAPTDYKAERGRRTVLDWLPSMEAFRYSWTAFHERLGLVGYRSAR